MTSKATPVLIASSGRSALGRRRFDLQKRPLEAFRACSGRSRNPPRQSDPSGATTWQRDPLGRITAKTQSVNDNPANPTSTTTRYSHSAGQLSQITYPSGLNVFYRRSAAGQITGIDVQEPGRNKPVSTFITNLSHTALGQPKAWRWASGDVAQRSFDADGRMSANEMATYQFDAAGRISAITQSLHASQTQTVATGGTETVTTRAFTTPITWTARYDSRNRLTAFTRAGASSAYTWDANGNRLSSIDTTRADTDLDGAFDAEDFSATTAQSLALAADSNRLLGFTQTLTNVRGTRTLSSTSAQVAYTLDGAGNLTSDGLRSFGHDASGRLSQVRIGLGSEEAATLYLHNALGQRVFKSEPQATQYAPDEEELGSDFIAWLKKNFGWLFARAQANATLGQSFVYADAPLPAWALLGEYGNGGSKSAGRLEIVWLPLEDTLVGLGSAQAIPVGLYRNGRFYAVHPDHLGTPRLITDEANLPVWQWPYSAFGANKPTGILKATPKPKQAYTNEPVLLKATNPALTFNLRFPGQYWDEESNLSYNYFRNYMPNQGRYSQPDPVGLEGGLNRFGYGEGNPISSIDPDGLQIIIPIPGPRPGGIRNPDFPPGVGPNQSPAPTLPSWSRDIWWPDRRSGQWSCKARADCNDNIPGNCPDEPSKRFSFGGGTANDLGTARNIAKANATSNLQCQPKHVSCKCTGPKGEQYSGGC